MTQNIVDKNPETQDIILSVRDLTMMFGRRKQHAAQMLADNKSKNEILKETGVTVAVDNISFDVERGKIHTLLGLSGSGKSTVVRCLNLLLTPTLGSIFFEGQDIQRFNAQQLRDYRRKHVSMVFQSFGLRSHRNVLDNVAYGLEVRGVSKKDRLDMAMQMIG